jgi:hypothetical protein
MRTNTNESHSFGMTDFCTGLGRRCFDELPGGAMLVAVHRTVEVLKG